MSHTVEDYPNVRQRAKDLNLDLVPELAFLPRGFSTAASSEELAHENEAATLRKILDDEGVGIAPLHPRTERLPTIVERQVEWIAPIIFIGSDFLLNNADGVRTLVNVLQSYITAHLANRLSSGKVKLSFVVETTPERRYKKLTFEGSPKRIQDIGEVLRSLIDE